MTDRYVLDWHLTGDPAGMSDSELIAAVFGLHSANRDEQYTGRILELQRERKRRRVVPH